MIRKTLNDTQAATFAILLPDPGREGMPIPIGTGFFISPDGWFVTAAHVITENNESDGPIRNDIPDGFLQKEPRELKDFRRICQYPELDFVIPGLDFALLKVDIEKNKGKDWLKGQSDFPYIQVSSRELDAAEPVYSFGYPLSRADLVSDGLVKVASISLSPRITSAIVSSKMEMTKMISTASDPKTYVLDKALNYGSSGGPIVATNTGHVHAFCSRYQPQFVPQPHLKDKDGDSLMIMSPSLYGIVVGLNNLPVPEELLNRGIPVLDL